MNKTFAVLAVSAFALMGCDSGTANAQNPSAMPAMSAEMQQQHDNMQKEIKQIRDQHAQIMDEHKTMKSDIRNLQDNQKKLWMNTAGLWTTIKNDEQLKNFFFLRAGQNFLPFSFLRGGESIKQILNFRRYIRAKE